MTSCEGSTFDEFLDFRVKMNQTDEVCDGGTIAADLDGNRVLSQTEFFHLARKDAHRNHRILVFALDILNQGE